MAAAQPVGVFQPQDKKEAREDERPRADGARPERYIKSLTSPEACLSPTYLSSSISIRLNPHIPVATLTK
jgi:hypothetical protein